MAIKIHEMMRRTRKVNVTYQGDEMEVTYRINVVTPAFVQQVQERADLVEQVCQVVETWDLVDDEGQRLKPSKELCNALPSELLSMIIATIAEDMRLGDAEKKGSAGG